MKFKNDKPEIKSINKTLTYKFAGIITFIVVLVWLLNLLFGALFYKVEKARDMGSSFNTINDLANTYEYSSEDFTKELHRLSRTNDFDILIASNDGSVMVSSFPNNVDGIDFFSAFLYQDNSFTIIEKDKYTIKQQKDRELGEDFVILFGTLDNGDLIVIKSPLKGIIRSIFIADKILLYIGLFAIILSVIISKAFARRLTEPILELESISRRMADLDFAVKYKPRKVKNEVDLLGEQMNSMSSSLEEAYRELQEANKQLEADIKLRDETDRMRKEFISNVSHELKTPLAIISGYAEGLLDGMSNDPETLNYYCEVIQDETNKMNDLVLSLIELNKLEYNSEPVAKEEVNLSEIIHACINNVLPLIESSEIEIQQEYDENITALANDLLVEAVLNNYLSNAIHFCKKERKIKVYVEELEDKYRINVYNSGDPIEEDKISYIWDKFYKMDEARSREYGGTGIGLSIVKASMENLANNYGVENLENGVVFWFELDKIISEKS